MLKFFTCAALLAIFPLTQNLPIATDSLCNTNNFFSPTHLSFKNSVVANPFETTAKNNAIDTTALKQSNWYVAAMKNIEASEYNISRDDQSNDYASPNRMQNLRGYYTNNQFTVMPRNDSADKWKLSLTLKGVFAGQQQLMAPVENAVITQNGSTIRFNNNNAFTTEYVNNKEGIRQNFIIHQEPEGNPKKLSIRLQANKGWYINKVNNTEIHFAKATTSGYSKKLTYNDLKVWDANHKTLDASFSVNENTISIDVDTKNAVYPVTVDPISTSPSATLNGITTGDQFGWSVASAGDVNGDGYSDVVAGANLATSGAGAAYIFLGSSTGLSNTPVTTLSNINGGAFGTSVASAGDINNDGYSDVIIGAPSALSSKGEAYIYLGGSGTFSATPFATITGNTNNDKLGTSVACAGDVNGDGFSDVVIGAEGVNTSTGAAYIFLGSSGAFSTTPAATLNGSATGDHFGYSVSGAGNINGDGFSDVVVGAYAVSSSTGAAYIFTGSSGTFSTTPATTINGSVSGSQFGWTVACAGDINGDGYSDVVIGAFAANSLKGVAYIFTGSSGAFSSTAAVTLNGGTAGDRFGYSVACAGDINGDGYSDICIGAIGVSSFTGAAYLFLGSAGTFSTTPSTTFNGSSAGDRFGGNVSSSGDINGDGYSDIISGAIGVASFKGAAYIFNGSPNGLSTSQTRILTPVSQSLANIGNAVAGAGDVNGDGFSDVIIGASGYDDGASTDEGRAWVYYGHANGLSASPDVVLDDANQAGAGFGYSVANAGDVNGDGYSDVIVGAIFYSGGNTNEGRAWVHYGSSSGLSVSANRVLNDANQSSAWFGNSVSSAGDVNGDGYGDVIVGARQYGGTGAAFVYYGHNTTGLSATPDRILTGENLAGASFGICVSHAGDINGDGYSDVVIGASGYSSSLGRAYVYNGSSSGLSASISRILSDGVQAGAGFGIRVAGVGDVNGDGFADVVVTAIFYDGSKGRAWLYYGHATIGLSATSDVVLDNNSGSAGDFFGYGLSSAGDVNADGYNDIIIGISEHTTTFTEDGRAYVYYGSPAGISATPSLILHDATEAEEFFGVSTACAGDINGDGYSDVLVGADHGSYGSTFGGRAFVYNGNDLIANKRNNLLMYNSDLITPINSTNFISTTFGAGLYSKSFLGRVKGKLVWETRINYNAYSGTPITNSTFFTAQQASYTDLGIAGAELKNVVNKLGGGQIYTKLRARVKYDPVTAITGQLYGPWRYVSSIIDANKLGALPIELVSFDALWLQKGKTAELNFITDKEAGICCFDIEKSTDGINYNSIGNIIAKNTGSRQSYTFTDINATNQKQFYRLKIIGNNSKTEYSNILQLQFNGSKEIWMFPNPTQDVLQLQLNGMYSTVNIQIVNSIGQTVKKLNHIAVTNQTIAISVSNLSAGQYWLKLQSGSTVQVLQFIKQ